MKRFSFSTFQVDEFNREALETCRAIADLAPMEPMPVLLLGDHGSGKTHLLYSIVNHVRAASEVTGLACVTAREFPDKVLQIIHDPTPVKRARSAILLVDQLESFTDKLDELEAVVRIFLSLGHYVLLTSDVHPVRLKHLPADFRALLEQGRVVPMKPHVLTTDNVVPGANRAMEELVKRQHEVIHQLREELENTRKRSDGAETIAELRRQCEAERLRANALSQQLAAERTSREALDEQAVKARAEVDTLRREMDGNREAVASIADIKQEVARLNRQLDEFKSEQAAAEHERSLLVAELSQKALLDEELELLRAELQRARAQSEQSQVDARAMLERVHAVLADVEANRSRFAEMEKKYSEQIDELECRVLEYAQSPGASEGRFDSAALEALRVEHEERQGMLEAQLSAAKAEAKTAMKARDSVQERLDQMTAVYASLEIDFDQLRAELSAKTAELDALKLEAAGQVAEANAQAGDIEHEYSRLLSCAEFSRETAQIVVAGLQVLCQQLGEQAHSVDKLVARLIEAADRAEYDLSRAPAGRAGGNGREQEEYPELDLFEAFNAAAMSRDAGNGERSEDGQSAPSFDLDAVIRAQAPFDLHESPSGS